MRSAVRTGFFGLKVALLLGAAILPRPSSAQDAHYWAIQNGARATLLGGAVVAGRHDLSAGYYNPAALVNASHRGVISTFVKTVTDVDVDVAGSDGVLATSSIGASAPGFVAVVLPFHLIQGDVLTASFIARSSSKLELGGLSSYDDPDRTASRDLFVFQDIHDGWYGVSWASGAGPVSLGFSLFLSSVSYRQRIQSTFVQLASADGGRATNDALDYSLAVRRAVAKAGVHWEAGPLSLGMTFTLPSVRMPASSGTISVTRSMVAPDAGSGVELAAARQRSIPADLRRPGSVAFGAELALGGLDVGTVLEWVGSGDPYSVLSTDSFTSQVGGERLDLPVMQGRRSVLNVGGGASLEVGAGLSVFASARTDRSFRPEGREAFVGLDGFDLTHLTGGIGVARERLELWLGVLRSAGEWEGSFRASPLPLASEWNAFTRFKRLGFVVALGAAL